MNFAVSHTFGAELCRIFGFDLDTTQDIHINLAPGKLVRVDATFLVRDDQARQVLRSLEHYKLAPLEPDETLEAIEANNLQFERELRATLTEGH